MLIFNYKSKKELRENIGKQLNYSETSMFGPEYKESGVLVGSNHERLELFYVYAELCLVCQEVFLHEF